MRRLVMLVILAACGDNRAVVRDDAAPAADAAIDAAPDAPAGRVKGCLDRPGLEMAPVNGQLPCDLVPPGLQL